MWPHHLMRTKKGISCLSLGVRPMGTTFLSTAVRSRAVKVRPGTTSATVPPGLLPGPLWAGTEGLLWGVGCRTTLCHGSYWNSPESRVSAPGGTGPSLTWSRRRVRDPHQSPRPPSHRPLLSPQSRPRPPWDYTWRDASALCSARGRAGGCSGASGSRRPLPRGVRPLGGRGAESRVLPVPPAAENSQRSLGRGSPAARTSS